jgi:hypothetical protein
MAHYRRSCVDSVAAALVALGIKDDVDNAPSTSGTVDSAGVNLNSAGRTPSADFASMLSTFQVSLSSRSDVADQSDDSSDEEDMEEDDGSDATHVAHGEEGDSGGDSANGNDPILVSDGEKDGEEGDSGTVPDNRDDPIVLTDGEEGDSDSDLTNPEKSVEPRKETSNQNGVDVGPSQSNEGSENHRRQEEETTAATPTPTQNEEESHPSLNNENSVEQEETATQNAEEPHASQSNERSKGTRRQETQARAEIRRRGPECMTREQEPDQAEAITAVKRKIQIGQMEDLPVAKRNLKTPSQATDV